MCNIVLGEVFICFGFCISPADADDLTMLINIRVRCQSVRQSCITELSHINGLLLCCIAMQLFELGIVLSFDGLHSLHIYEAEPFYNISSSLFVVSRGDHYVLLIIKLLLVARCFTSTIAVVFLYTICSRRVLSMYLIIECFFPNVIMHDTVTESHAPEKKIVEYTEQLIILVHGATHHIFMVSVCKTLFSHSTYPFVYICSL